MFGALLLFEDEFIHVVSISFTGLILTELIMVALTIRTWHWLMVIAEFISLAIYILSLIILKDIFGKFFFLYFNQPSDKGPSINNVSSGHCVFKWILRGHLKPTPSATIKIMFEVNTFGSFEVP